MTSLTDIRDTLRAQEPVLRRLGLRSLVLFGSAARGEAHGSSDLDFLYEFDPGAATLDHLLDLEETLSYALGRDVDLVSRVHLSPILERYIGSDVVTVYDAKGTN
ncbi:nucleotidyltransferase family protein [Rubrivirga sp.]|uniref:nucleotidyltransferase family protein n=1 Tax=Rubrivirga sp. TaxID=1885344 RepID=UPI003C77DA46